MVPRSGLFHEGVGKHLVSASEGHADGERGGILKLMLCGCCRFCSQLISPNVSDGTGFLALPHLPPVLISDGITFRAKRDIHLMERFCSGHVSTKSAVEETV